MKSSALGRKFLVCLVALLAAGLPLFFFSLRRWNRLSCQ